MHYANGRAAKVGDLVRGKGYNVKHEIIGILLAAQPANTTCNCTVAHVDVTSAFISRGWRSTTESANAKVGDIVFQSTQQPDGTWKINATEVIASLEYGQLDAFVALDPATGEILLPEI